MKTVPVRTFYLEMRQPPLARLPAAPVGATIEQLPQPEPEFYLKLYNAVGEPWGWVDRNLMPRDELAALLRHPGVEVHLLRHQGEVAGYAELDCRSPAEIELAYFGLTPAHTGKGLGTYLLAWTLHRAWSHRPQRVWVHTCEWDHPAALPTYRKAGFTLYAERLLPQRVPTET